MILCTVFAGFSKNRVYLKLHPFSKILREFLGQVYCGYKVKLSLLVPFENYLDVSDWSPNYFTRWTSQLVNKGLSL